jgi:hypothetical protein
MALIAANCVMLSLFNPTAPESKMHSQMATVELAFNIVFTAEMMLRILSVGSLYGYLRNPWNIFDAIMVLAGYVTVTCVLRFLQWSSLSLSSR